MLQTHSPAHSTLPRQKGDYFPSEVTYAHSPRVFGLDFLRAAAILFVLVAHGTDLLMPFAPWWFAYFGHGGFYGVELFFVLSGFLIGTILVRSGSTLGEPNRVAIFYIRRWFRTLPLFWLFLGVHIILEHLLRNHHMSYSEIAQQGLFLRNLAALRITFFPESWSLAVEEWFYLIFPAALWLGLQTTRRFDRVLLSVALAFFLFSTIARMISAPHAYATWTEWQRKIVIYRFDGLMLGVFAAWVSQRFGNSWRNYRWLCAIIGLALLIAMYATLWTFSGQRLKWSADTYFARTFRFSLVSLGFALLLPIASLWKVANETLFTTVVRRIALWSYALYLVGLPLLQLFGRYIPLEWKMSLSSAVLIFSLQVGAFFLVSASLYRFYESRCTHLREKVAPLVADLGKRARRTNSG